MFYILFEKPNNNAKDFLFATYFWRKNCDLKTKNFFLKYELRNSFLLRMQISYDLKNLLKNFGWLSICSSHTISYHFVHYLRAVLQYKSSDIANQVPNPHSDYESTHITYWSGIHSETNRKLFLTIYLFNLTNISNFISQSTY